MCQACRAWGVETPRGSLRCGVYASTGLGHIKHHTGPLAKPGDSVAERKESKIMVVSRMLDGGRAGGKQGVASDDRKTRGREVKQDSMRLCSLWSSSPRDVPKHGRDENRNRLKRARQTDSLSGGLEQAEEADLPHGISCLGLLANQTGREGGEEENGLSTQRHPTPGCRTPRLWLAKRQKVPESPRKCVNAGWILCTRQRGKHMADRRGRFADSWAGLVRQRPS